jgi:N-acetylglucosaminyl-diphospho-decaprenol L-rhamnosyltransferase
VSAAGDVTAVVVNYNARALLLQCIESLRDEGVDDVIVADNASADGSEEAVRAADAAVRYHQTGRNLGYGTGVNRGVSFAGGDTAYLLICNPDIVVAPGAVEALVSSIEKDPQRAIVGPRIEEPDGTLYPSARTFPDLADAVGHAFLGMIWPRNPFTRRYRMLDWDHAEPAEVDWVSGSCFLMRRDAFEAIGGFDEAYFMYAEDVDLCWRVRQAGWTVAYEPGALVTHVQGASTDRHPYWMIAEHHKALLRFARKTTTGRKRLLLPLMAVGLALRTPIAWGHRYLAGRKVK